MTEEERKRLLEELRDAAFYRGSEFSVCDTAADEIERLAKQVRELDRQVDHYHGKWGRREND